MASASLPFRAADRGEDGTEFVDYLYQLAAAVAGSPTTARALAQRAWVFVQQLDYLRDELVDGGAAAPAAPSIDQYAERWRMPYRTAARAFAEFDSLFPHVEPWRVCAELWEGVGRQAPPRSFMQVGRVKVVRAPEASS
jgi:hypothetical protein